MGVVDRIAGAFITVKKVGWRAMQAVWRLMDLGIPLTTPSTPCGAAHQTRMPCVYVAGAYSADHVDGVFANIRRGLDAGAVVLRSGFSVYLPWLDSLLAMRTEYPAELAKACSMAWLERSDAVLVVPEGAERSQGTQAEISCATRLGIPVFYEPTLEESVEKMREYFFGPLS